jgi:hypothetical protein
VLGPLSKLNGSESQPLYILVVDALDECDGDKDIRTILYLLAEVRSLETVRLRVFLTSRPEIPIRHGFYQMPDAEHQDFILHNISQRIVNHDITVFLEYNLKIIRQERSLGAAWPGEDAVLTLVQKANGLFIYAATACRFIHEGKSLAIKRLDTLARSTTNTATAPEKHLNEIYMTVLKHSISPEYTDDEKKDVYSMLRQVLGSIVLLFSPLSTHSLSELLHIAGNGVDQAVEDLHSVLDVPKESTRLIRLHHPSFRDFLLNRDRCNDPNLWVDEKIAHENLANNCIQLMSRALEQHICGVKAPGTLVTDVGRHKVEQSIPPEVQYACLYWIQHLEKSGAQLQDGDQVHHFLQTHLLHWLEALGWMGKASEGVYAITSLESLTTVGWLAVP